VTYEWNHGLGEIVQAVLDVGLTLTRLEEHTEVEWPALPGMVEDPDTPGRFPCARHSATGTADVHARGGQGRSDGD
jgi:hypothetical protein